MDNEGISGKRTRRDSLESTVVHNPAHRIPRTRKQMASIYNDALDIPLDSELQETCEGESIQNESMATAADSLPDSTSSELHPPRRRAKKAKKSRKPAIEELGEFKFSFFDGLNDHPYDVASLSALFPQFATACKTFAQEQELPFETFISVAAYSLPEDTNRKKRFQVYRRLAWAAGWADRTKLPDYLEQAVKSTWSESGEEFVGFREAN